MTVVPANLSKYLINALFFIRHPTSKSKGNKGKTFPKFLTAAWS
jgi:hypothetical protein